MLFHATPAPKDEPQDRDGYHGEIPHGYSKHCKPDGYGGCHSPSPSPAPSHSRPAHPSASASPGPGKSVPGASPSASASVSQPTLPVTGNTAGGDYAMYGGWLVIAGVLAALGAKYVRRHRTAR